MVYHEILKEPIQLLRLMMYTASYVRSLLLSCIQSNQDSRRLEDACVCYNMNPIIIRAINKLPAAGRQNFEPQYNKNLLESAKKSKLILK